jgi:hypothetical protein
VIEILDHGSIVLFIPLDACAKEWLEDNTDAEPWQWLGGALAVDHRAARALAEAVQP